MTAINTDRPCALFQDGKVTVFVGGAYRTMTVEAAQRLERQLAEAINAALHAQASA